MSRLRWGNRPVGARLSSEIEMLFQADANLTDYAVREAIIVILAEGSRLPQTFIDTARIRGNRKSNRRGLWIAVLLALDDPSGLARLKRWVKSASSNEERANRVWSVVNELLNDDRNGVAVAHNGFATVPILRVMLAYLYGAPSDQEKFDEGENYRNSDQGKRDRLLQLLFNIPGRETYDALITLADTAHDHGDYLLTLAERRAEQDSEARSWSARTYICLRATLSAPLKLKKSYFG